MHWMLSSNQLGPMRIWVPRSLSLVVYTRVDYVLVAVIYDLGDLHLTLGALTFWRVRYYLMTKDSCFTILYLHRFGIRLCYFHMLWVNFFDVFYCSFAHSYRKAGPEVSFLFKNLLMSQYIKVCHD